LNFPDAFLSTFHSLSRTGELRGLTKVAKLESTVIVIGCLSLLSAVAVGVTSLKDQTLPRESYGVVWLEDWLYRKAHNIAGSTAGAQFNYPMLMTVRYDSGVDFEGHVYLHGKCKPDFGDIRFTDSTGLNSLDYWIESKVDGVQALVWVEIPHTPPAPEYATIYLYYGNLNASTTSNKNWTFDFATDFEDGTVQGWSISWITHISFDGVSTTAFQGTYSRAAGRIYGSDNAGNGDFYEHFWNGVYLTSGTYRMEGAARFGVQDSYKVPKNITIRAAGIALDSFSNPGVTWHWLGGNFTLETGSYVELDVEFHLRVQNLHTGSESYFIDSLVVRRWCDPEPAHHQWGVEETSDDKTPPNFHYVQWRGLAPYPYLPSTTVRANEPVLINVNVTDNLDGILEVVASYRINTGAWWNTTMQYNETEDNYQATIPGQRGNTTVEFYITASDAVGNKNASQLQIYGVQPLITGDLDGDGDVDIYDIVMAADNYGKTYP